MSSIEAASPTSTTNRPSQKPDNDEVTDIVRNGNGESKSREVSPKLVVGGRKYGRRSRPQSAVAFDSSQSESDDDQNAHDRNTSAADKARSKRVSDEKEKIIIICTRRSRFHSIDSMGKFKVNALPLPSKRPSTYSYRVSDCTVAFNTISEYC